MKSSPAAVFLDRDGTLIVEKEYLSDPRHVEVEQGVVDGLGLLQRHGHPLIVVSNQSGIGRGIFTARDAERVNQHLATLLRDSGIELQGWYICPHAPDAPCDCRKPAPGLALAASRELRVELAGSFVVGDKRSDLELADAIGGTGILVTTGHGRDAVPWATAHARPVFAVCGRRRNSSSIRTGVTRDHRDRRHRFHRLELVADLNAAGRSDIILVDDLGSQSKWKNIARRRIQDVVLPAELEGLLARLSGGDVVYHMGANSSTTATDGDAILLSNFRTSKLLWEWCARTRTPFIYASSAATYGDGALGFKTSRCWSAGRLQAAESVWLVETRLRQMGRRPKRGPECPAAMVRPEVLQRVRPQ